MAATNFTPISLYHSTTAAAVPTAGNLVAGELALNTVDEKLYFKNSAGTVKLLASNATSAPVLSFQTSLSGLTPSTATTGVVTLAGTLGVASGGTGLTTLATGSLSYGAGTSAFSALAIGTAGQILTSTGTAPQWSTLSGVAVTTFSAGTTGFTPSSATSGAVTLAGTLATTNGGTGLTSFTSGGVVYASSSSVLATGSALTFNGTNLGLGIALSNWSGGFKAIQNQGTTILSGGTLDGYMAQNYFNDGANKYISTGFATSYSQSTGQHIWYNAPSGTAGNAVTFTQAMTLDNSGNLGVGNTSPSARFDLTSSAQLLANFNSSNVSAGYIQFQSSTTSYGFIGSAATLSSGSSTDFTVRSQNNLLFTSGGGSERGRFDSAGTFSIENDYQEQTFTANSSTAITLNIVTNGTDQVITLTGTATITMPTATAGKSFLLKLKTGAGAYTVTWTTVKWPGGTAPTLTSTASRMDIFSFFSDGTNWYGTTVGQNYTP